MFSKSITKEQLNQLSVKSFDGTIHLIDTEEQIADALAYLNKCSILGFDTETKPAFKKGEKHEVALLQLSDGKHAFLFRLNKIGLPHKLQMVLANPNIIKVGAAILDDMRALASLDCLPLTGFVELQTLVRKYGIENVSLQKMTAIVLQFKISKRQQISNWEAAELTEAQQRYAATDGWVGYKIFTTMRTVLGRNFKYTLQDNI